MRLYVAPGAGSLSPHIALSEAGVVFELERVDRSKRTASGEDYLEINPLGLVPALRLDHGQLLTEGQVIVQYVADLVPNRRLAPLPGTFERYRLQEWLSFIATEIHKGFGPLFAPDAPPSLKQATRDRLLCRLDHVVQRLGTQPYLMGETFTVADGYLYTMLTWRSYASIDLARWPVLERYFDLVRARPAVRAALDAEERLRAA